MSADGAGGLGVTGEFEKRGSPIVVARIHSHDRHFVLTVGKCELKAERAVGTQRDRSSADRDVGVALGAAVDDEFGIDFKPELGGRHGRFRLQTMPGRPLRPRGDPSRAVRMRTRPAGVGRGFTRLAPGSSGPFAGTQDRGGRVVFERQREQQIGGVPVIPGDGRSGPGRRRP